MKLERKRFGYVPGISGFSTTVIDDVLGVWGHRVILGSSKKPLAVVRPLGA